MQANNMNPDLGPYCLQYRLPKNVSRKREQTTKVVTGGGKRIIIFSLSGPSQGDTSPYIILDIQ